MSSTSAFFILRQILGAKFPPLLSWQAINFSCSSWFLLDAGHSSWLFCIQPYLFFPLEPQHTKWWRRGQIISSTIPSAECYRNFLRPRKHNVPSCSGAPPELGTAPNFLSSTKPAPPSPPPTTPPSTCHPLPPLRQSHIPGKFSRLCWHQNRAIPFKMDIGEIFPLIGPTMFLEVMNCLLWKSCKICPYTIQLLYT